VKPATLTRAERIGLLCRKHRANAMAADSYLTSRAKIASRRADVPEWLADQIGKAKVALEMDLDAWRTCDDCRDPDSPST
jgi:hypothetical protein